MKTFTILATLCLCAFASAANINHSTKIMGGQIASPGQFPYIASIRLAGGLHLCGGAILNKRTILTAASCKISTSMIVVVGTNTIINGGNTHTISKVINHPEYNTIYKDGDLAVVIIYENIEFNEIVQPIPLASSKIVDDAIVTISGWGWLRDPGIISNDLQYFETKTYSTEVCKKLSARVDVEKMICIFSDSGEGTCNGDYGGPLVAYGELHGIIFESNQFHCVDGKPDLFTSVYLYKTWIETNSYKI